MCWRFAMPVITGGGIGEQCMIEWQQEISLLAKVRYMYTVNIHYVTVQWWTLRASLSAELSCYLHHLIIPGYFHCHFLVSSCLISCTYNISKHPCSSVTINTVALVENFTDTNSWRAKISTIKIWCIH